MPINVTPRTAGYRVYAALLSQSGTDAPVATVLQNTLGGTVAWSYVDTGKYNATLAGAFPANKVPDFSALLAASQSFDGGTSSAKTVYIFQSSSDVCRLTVRASDGTAEDDDLNNTFIEIRVYP